MEVDGYVERLLYNTNVLDLKIDGGNGTGCVAYANLKLIDHSVEFDSTSFASGSSSATRSMVIYNASADGALSMDAEL